MSNRFRVAFVIAVAAVVGFGVGLRARRVAPRASARVSVPSLHDRYLEALQNSPDEAWI